MRRLPPEHPVGGMLTYFFFFQAEDGIRDVAVTGVQTCALPIFYRRAAGFFLAIARSRSAVLCGRREPCSQLCTAFGLTQRKCANMAWLACRLSQIGRASCRERV